MVPTAGRHCGFGTGNPVAAEAVSGLTGVSVVGLAWRISGLAGRDDTAAKAWTFTDSGARSG